ncbi:MAG: hypothetical protein P4L43_18860 [Syntrophobacteraceae bacterium]|nr:hypothetical protein [Syntrophobacteraceae bacterium]
MLDNLRQLTEKVNELREYIVPTDRCKPSVRHKVLAHLDKNTIMSDITLGAFPEKEDEKFMDIPGEIASVMHKACFDSILGVGNPVVLGGVRDFKDALRYAVAFRKALSEFRGQELAKLVEILYSLP